MVDKACPARAPFIPFFNLKHTAMEKILPRSYEKLCNNVKNLSIAELVLYLSELRTRKNPEDPVRHQERIINTQRAIELHIKNKKFDFAGTGNQVSSVDQAKQFAGLPFIDFKVSGRGIPSEFFADFCEKWGLQPETLLN